MPLSLERYIALRYLRRAQGRSEGRRFLRLITFISVGGVAVGVATLILALSIVRGFSREIESKIVGFGAQIQVESFRDAPLDNASELYDRLVTFEAVENVSPVVQEFVLLRKSSTRIDGVSIWGTDVLPDYLVGALQEGNGTFDPSKDGHAGMVIGRKLASSLALNLGDRITAFSLRNRDGVGSLARTPKVKQFHVSGIFETSLANFDELYVFTDIATTRSLLEYRQDEVTRYDLSLHEGFDPQQVAEMIDANLTFPVMARSIYDVYRSLFAWVNLQENIIPLVIGIIILVAAFNIIGTLLMIILEKTREVGILASMGASAASLRKLFLTLGLYIGATGVILGEATALVFAWIQLQYSIIPLPEEAYYMSTAPIQLSIYDFIIVGILTLIMCAASSYFPARFASSIEPIKAIHSS
ncbi:MAG: ABC transporter permease [Rhodothermia bacterium]|nr:MAG: ABC transporter permease [Rhodothermia bacterium]